MWAYCLNNPVAMVDSNGQETNWNTLLKVCTRILLARAAYWCIMLANTQRATIVIMLKNITELMALVKKLIIFFLRNSTIIFLLKV